MRPLAWVSIAAAVLGCLGVVVLNLPGWREVPFWPAAAEGPVLGATLAVFVVAAVTGAIAVCRLPRPGAAARAVIVGALGFLAFPVTVISGLQGHTTVDPSELYAKTTAARHLSVQHPLSFGTRLTLQAAEGGRDILEVSPGEPTVITGAALAAAAPRPRNGEYIAIPITVRELDPKALADRHSRSGIGMPSGTWPERDTSWYARTDWFPARGVFAPQAYVYHPVISVPGYPRRAQAAMRPDGTVSYYEILDVPPQSPTLGVYMWWLIQDAPYGSAYWGAGG